MEYTQEGSIKNFWPDDDDKTMYIYGTLDIPDLLDRIAAKWPTRTLSDVKIDAEHIHTHSITYDLHVPSDYTDFIVVRLK